MIHDEHDTKDMIKIILQKIIDEMNTLESDRIMPEDRKPKAVKVEVESAIPIAVEGEEDEDLDPTVLTDLLTKAGEADETGAPLDDIVGDFPPEINDAVRRRRQVK